MTNRKIGIDMVDVRDLQQKIQLSSKFISYMLSEQEREGCTLETLAGKIAAKEAIIKTGFIRSGDWHDICIMKNEEGAPIVVNLHGVRISELEISITHTFQLAVAVALYEKT